MKRPKIKPPRPAPPPCTGQLPLFDRVTNLILETNSDPDYNLFFPDVLRKEYGT